VPDRLARWGRRLVWCTAALAAVWSLYSLTRPFGFDHGVFAWLGDVLLAGGVPYRDAWDTKGPAAFALAAAAQWLFGRDEWGIRLLDLAWLAAGAAGAAAMVRRLGGGRSAGGALSAAALLFLWYASLDYRNTAQPDGWAAVLLAGAALVLAGRGRSADEGRGWRAAVAGALVGVCALVKPTYGLFLVVPLAAGLVGRRSPATPAYPRGRPAWAAASTWTAALAAGFVAPLAACVAWFAARGALRDLFEVYVVWTATVYGGLENGWLWRLQSLVTGFLATPLALALPLILLGAMELARRDRRAAAIVLTWIAAAFVNVAVQGKYWPYHWLPAYPPLAVLAGLGVGAAYAASARRGAGRAGVELRDSPVEAHHGPAILRRLLAGSVCAAAIGAGAQPLLDVYRWGKLLAGAEAPAAYRAREYVISEGYPRDSLAAIGRYVRARTAASEGVLFWGLAPGVNYLIERRPPGRFALELPLVRGEGTAVRAAYRREFMALMTGPAAPKYVVTLDARACPQPTTAVGAACPALYPDFAALLERDYPVERVIGGFEVRRRRNQGGGARCSGTAAGCPEHRARVPAPPSRLTTPFSSSF
jgi:hypothetical protein